MKTAGFSLIELMITLAVMAVIICFTYPNYSDYLQRGRRLDGQTALLDLASRLENYYADQQTYATATLASGKATDVLATNLSPNGWYSLRISSQSQSGFILEAIPQKSQVQDKACKTLTFDNLGIKASTGYLNSCW